MIAPGLSLAHLSHSQEQLIRSLEAELACRVTAYLEEEEVAQLSPEAYGKLRKLELELGIALVAYSRKSPAPLPDWSIHQTSRIASLESKHLMRLQEAEAMTGLILMAYEA
jgi:hypothetical protein